MKNTRHQGSTQIRCGDKTTKQYLYPEARTSLPRHPEAAQPPAPRHKARALHNTSAKPKAKGFLPAQTKPNAESADRRVVREASKPFVQKEVTTNITHGAT